MSDIKEHDRVRIITREATEEDLKSAMYFAHYGGLAGSVLKIYDSGEYAIEVEQDSLTKEIRKRHEDVRDQMKTKWLDGLSEEGRNKLTEREKNFNLRYIVLVVKDDLEQIAPRPVAQAGATPKPAQHSTAPNEATTPHRKTMAEIEAAEEAELQKRQNQ